MSDTPVPQVSIASVLCNYLLMGLGPIASCTHQPGYGLPEDTVRVDARDVVLSFTCVAPPMFSDKVAELATAQAIDVVLVRCFAESFDALPATIEATLAGGGLAPFTLRDLTLYRHTDDTLWLVPTGFGAAVRLTTEGLLLEMVPPYETLIDRACGIYRSTAEIARRLYWMRIESPRGYPEFVDDETGRTWPSLRAAFWSGRLGLPEQRGGPPVALLETMHAVLAMTARRPSPLATAWEDALDLFEKSRGFRSMFLLWLAHVGLVTLDDSGIGATGLTAEGWSVLHMLAATRPYDVRDQRPSAASVAQLVELGLGPEPREERLARLEREAARWDAAFLRRTERGRPAIILATRGDGAIPVKRTIWSLPFDTARARDTFYDWLCRRLDRWQAWGELADRGAEKLTHHLLAMVASELDQDTGADGGRRLGS